MRLYCVNISVLIPLTPQTHVTARRRGIWTQHGVADSIEKTAWEGGLMRGGAGRGCAGRGAAEEDEEDERDVTGRLVRLSRLLWAEVGGVYHQGVAGGKGEGEGEGEGVTRRDVSDVPARLLHHLPEVNSLV